MFDESQRFNLWCGPNLYDVGLEAPRAFPLLLTFNVLFRYQVKAICARAAHLSIPICQLLKTTLDVGNCHRNSRLANEISDLNFSVRCQTLRKLNLKLVSLQHFAWKNIFLGSTSSSVNAELKVFTQFSLVLWPNFRECIPSLAWNVGKSIERAPLDQNKNRWWENVLVFFVQFELIDEVAAEEALSERLYFIVMWSHYLIAIDEC